MTRRLHKYHWLHTVLNAAEGLAVGRAVLWGFEIGEHHCKNEGATVLLAALAGSGGVWFEGPRVAACPHSRRLCGRQCTPAL